MKKNDNKSYCLVNVTMKINEIIIKDMNLLSAVDEFVKDFAECVIVLLIDFFSEYNQIFLNKSCRNIRTFMTLLRLLRMKILSQKAMNSVVQFVHIEMKIFENYILDKC